MNKIPSYLISLGLIALIFGVTSCDKIPFLSSKSSPQTSPATEKVEGTVLAKAGPSVITLEDFNSRVDNFNQASEGQKITTFDDKKSFLQAFVQQELFYQRGLSLGLDKESQIKKIVNDFRKTIIVQKLISDELGSVSVDNKEVENYYELAKNNFRLADEVKASEIVVASLDSAKQILIELLKGTDFASMATQYSKAASARNGGSLGWIKKGARKLDRFDEVVFALKKGDISNIFATPDGYFIVKVEDRKGGELKPLSEVWEQVRNELLNYKQSQKIVELERELRGKSAIEIHEELLR